MEWCISLLNLEGLAQRLPQCPSGTQPFVVTHPALASFPPGLASLLSFMCFSESPARHAACTQLLPLSPPWITRKAAKGEIPAH